jgi:hypothetical protein
MADYRHFVIPATCGLIPSPARICNLLQRLRETRYLPAGPSELEIPGELRTLREPLDEDGYLALMGADFRQSWQLEWPRDQRVRYPFMSPSQPPLSWTLQLNHSPEFLSPLSELIDPLQDPVGGEQEPRSEGLLARVKGLFSPRVQLLDLAIRCECGGALESYSDVFVRYSVLLARCPDCGKAFRPEQRRAKLRSAWSSAVNRRPGGLMHRFAVVFDCGQRHPVSGGPGVLEPELANLISNSLGTSLFEFADLS